MSVPTSNTSPPDSAERAALAGGPMGLYRLRRQAGRLAGDPAQLLALEKLQSLWRALKDYKPNNGAHGWRARLGLARSADPSPSGLYIFGPVGRGKSLLMDMFYKTAPLAKRRRVHFYAFMAEIHRRIHERRDIKGDPIGPVAKEIARETILLCFDEFQVTDIADAMILGRLFEALFELGVVVVATSNRAPDDLYKDGLQRDRFLPFIDLLKQKLDILELDGGRDYRLARLEGRPVYHVPADIKSHQALAQDFANLTAPAEARSVGLHVQGRVLIAPRAAKDVAWFTFEDLCGQALGPADYLALCVRFRTIIVESIPKLDRDLRNEAKRFSIFIDTLYEAHGNLIASAAVPPQELYTEGDGAFEFERTVSRLMEMQSVEYLAARAG